MTHYDSRMQLKIEMLKAIALMDKGITVKEIDHNPIKRELFFISENWIADGPISNRDVFE